jgi:hypothetical protein
MPENALAMLGARSASTKPKSFASQLHDIYNCVPQLETRLNGTSLVGAGSRYPYIDNSTQSSGDCNKFLYGPATNP